MQAHPLVTWAPIVLIALMLIVLPGSVFAIRAAIRRFGATFVWQTIGGLALVLIVLAVGFFGVRSPRVVQVAHPTANHHEVKVPLPTDQLEPSSKPREAAPRPVWVRDKPIFKDNQYQMSIAAGPYATVEECETALDQEVHEQFARIVGTYLDDDSSVQAGWPDQATIRGVVRNRWWEQTDSPTVGPMLTLHALLVFDAQLRDHVRELHRQAQLEARLWQVGGIAALVLGLMAAGFGYLKSTAPSPAGLREPQGSEIGAGEESGGGPLRMFLVVSILAVLFAVGVAVLLVS